MLPDRNQDGLSAYQPAALQMELVVFFESGEADLEAFRNGAGALALSRGVGLPRIPASGFQIALERVALVDRHQQVDRRV